MEPLGERESAEKLALAPVVVQNAGRGGPRWRGVRREGAHALFCTKEKGRQVACRQRLFSPSSLFEVTGVIPSDGWDVVRHPSSRLFLLRLPVESEGRGRDHAATVKLRGLQGGEAEETRTVEVHVLCSADLQRKKAAEWAGESGEVSEERYKLVRAESVPQFVAGSRRRPAKGEAGAGPAAKRQKTSDAPVAVRHQCSFLREGCIEELDAMVDLERLSRTVQAHIAEGRRHGKELYGQWERDMRKAGMDPEEHREKWYQVQPVVVRALQQEQRLLDFKVRRRAEDEAVAEDERARAERKEKMQRRKEEMERQKEIREEAERAFTLFPDEAISEMKEARMALRRAAASGDPPPAGPRSPLPAHANSLLSSRC